MAQPIEDPNRKAVQFHTVVPAGDSKTQMLAYEVRQTLAAIRSLAELALAASNEKSQPYAAAIVQAVDALNTRIETSLEIK